MKTLQNTFQNALALAHGFLTSDLVPVFDMDGVFADATHRQICNPDGSLNLDKYREMSTAEHIAKDEPLPLITALVALSQARKEFYICTARVACENTRAWLANYGIKPVEIFARDGENDARRDYDLKATKLSAAFTAEERMKMILIDDNVANCEAAKRIGMNAINVPFEGH